MKKLEDDLIDIISEIEDIPTNFFHISKEKKDSMSEYAAKAAESCYKNMSKDK